MKKMLVLGLDLGGTKIAAGVVDSSGRLLASVRIPTPRSGVQRDLAALFDAAHSAVAGAEVSWTNIRAVGVGVPGAFDPATESVWAPNLPGWGKVPLKRLLEKAFARPVFVEGDRNVQALAELWLGGNAARGRVRNLVFITVGTGIGAGMICGGRLITGARGVAGAAGWMAVSADWQPEFERLGCLEALGAGPAAARLAGEALRRRSQSLLARLAGGTSQDVTAEIVARAARRGDRGARRVLETVGANLGRGVASIVSLLNPEVVVVGGGLAQSGELLLQPLRRAARRWGQPLASRHVRIVRSRLGERAGVLGAARFCLLKLQEKI
jgi:glucokinase